MCNAGLWQGRETTTLCRPCECLQDDARFFEPHATKQQKARAHRPGFFWHRASLDQAAGLNSFEALFLIGSAVSVATFWVSSVSSLL